VPRILLLALLLGAPTACQAAPSAATATTVCRSAVAGEAGSDLLPELTGRVVDGADLLPPAVEARVDGALAALERRTTDQLIVVTVTDLKGEAIEDYGLRLGNGWGIGREDIDNGVLLIVAPNERRVRIEVGCGLEGLLTNERAAQIIDETLLPAFKAEEFEKGIVAGVEAIAATLRSDPARPQPGRKRAA
jgi:uncharacterized protein